MSFDPDLWVRAVRFAASAHGDQRVPGSGHPYLAHVTSVAGVVASALLPEHDANLAIACALLHDTVEDTQVTADAIAAELGRAVADGVQALSKDPHVPKAERLADSLRRIRLQPREVWMVKLADRIVNLTPPAPPRWSAEKRAQYRDEGAQILDALGEASELLAKRLRAKIDAYPL